MPITMTPTAFEGYDEIAEGAFIVRAADEAAAEITISTYINVNLWDEIAPLIRQALLAMRLEGDKTE